MTQTTLLPCPFCGGKAKKLGGGTLEGVMKAEKGDWIIKGIKGELYPCKADIFEGSYEQA